MAAAKAAINIEMYWSLISSMESIEAFFVCKVCFQIFLYVGSVLCCCFLALLVHSILVSMLVLNLSSCDRLYQRYAIKHFED